MLETGWSEDDLADARPRTVAALRHALYARAHAPILGVDVDDRLRELAWADMDGRRLEHARRSHNRTVKAALGQLRALQKAIREALHLDDPSVPPEDEA